MEFHVRDGQTQNLITILSTMWAGDGATSVHVTKHLYEERLRDLVYMKSIYMK